MNLPGWSLLFMCLALASPRGAHAQPVPPVDADDVVTCLVVDEAGTPVPSVVVFAAEASNDRISKVGVADDGGRVTLVIPRRPHNFGLLTPTFGVHSLRARGPTDLVLVVRPIRHAPVVDVAGASAPWITGTQAFIVRGRVVDELGVGLGGVRIDAVRSDGAVASSAITGVAGDFAVATPGGRYRLRATAPGLAPARWEPDSGGKRLTVVMAISADVQRLEITDGQVLSFRLDDSVDPEYYPPAKVLAWLRYAYGVCPAADPPTAHQRRRTKKYWWLDVLREAPSSPAQRATFAGDPCHSRMTFTERSAAWRSENKPGGFGPLP